MRKILFFAIALITSATMMAAGGDGSSRSEAIHFDWEAANLVEANTTTWYRLGLADLSEKANDPVIALYLNNLSTEQAEVNIAASALFKVEFLGQKVEQEFTIDPKSYLIEGEGHDIWTLPTTFDLSAQVNGNKLLERIFTDPANVSLLDLCGYGIQVYLEVETDKQIDIATSIYEKEEIIDDACTHSVNFNWAGETVAAGEKWFYLNLAEVKASNEKLNFVVKNAGAVEANVAFDLYLDCPASAIALDYDWTIAAGDEKVESLGRFLLNQISADYVYLKLTTDQEVTLKAEKEELPPPTPADTLFNATGALDLGNKLSLNNEAKIVKVIIDSLVAPKGYKTVCEISNIGSSDATLKQEVAFEPLVTIHNSEVKNLTVAAGTKVEMPISNKTLNTIKSDVAYFRLSTTGTMNITFKKVLVDAPATEPTIVAPACDESYLFDWNSTIKQKAYQTKWYELDVAPIKQNKEQVQISFTNSTDSMMIAIGSILLDCKSKDTISYVLPIPAGKTINKVLDYSLFAASPLDHAYISVTVVPTAITVLTDLQSVKTKEDAMNLIAVNPNAEIELTATRASALVDPTLCQTTHQTIEKGRLYTQEAGTTKWYRFTDEFMMNELQLLSTITLETYGEKPANVTLGATIGCNYGIATKFSVNVPKWVDLTTLYPAALFNVVDKVVNETVTEFYVEITTDEPIAFGFGLIRPSSLGCDDAQVFNWATGATLTPRNPNWYKFDITELREDKQQVKLTFTNPTDSLAWVASFVTLECPFYAGVPTIFPVPAHGSVDKWVDYSFFAASPMTDLYVAAITDAPLQLKAYKESAVIEKPEGCKNALTIEKGVTYTQEAGTTQWYHVPDALLDELSFFPEFTFVNNGPATAHLTMGSTVGCEYGILTKGTIKVPTWGDLTLSLPRWIGEAVDRLVNDDVTEFYVELHTDQPIMFGIDIAYGNMFGCDNAREFDWNTGVTVTPRDAQWHKFDITELKANEMQAKLTFTNTADSIAWVAAFVTYECPFKAGLPMVFPVPAGASVDKWIDYSFFASSPTNDLYLAVYTDSHIRIDAMQETAKITPATDCIDAIVVEPNVEYTIQPGTTWYKFSSEPFLRVDDTHARLSFANKSGKTATVTTGATVGCEYGILTRGKLKVPQMDVDVNVPLWVFGIMRQFVSEDVEQYYLQVTTDEALGFQIEVNMKLDTVYVNDTTYAYVCEGTDFVHPYTGATYTVFSDSVFVDTIHTADPLLDSVLVYFVEPVHIPQLIDMVILDSIGAMPILTPGLLPDTTGTAATILQFYVNNDTENVADVLNVSWENADVVVDCNATSHMMRLIVEDACGNIIPIPFNFPVVANTTTETDTVAACDSYTWAQNGITYTTSGIYVDTVAHPVTGCDSVYRELHLTINHPTYGDTTATICQSELPYSWHGIVMNVAGDTTAVVGANANGCDSIVTLHLIVNTPTYGDTIATICRGDLPFTWHGIDMTAAGDTTAVVGANANGCDSIVTLHLNVLEPTYGDTTATIYPYQLPYTWRGIVMNAAGDTSTVVGPNVEGCDSIVTLHLVVDPTVVRAEVNIVDTVCAGTEYQGRLTKKVINAVEVWTDSVNVLVAGVPTDSIYNYSVQPYLVVTPIVPADSIIVICGNAINVEPAEALIQAHIDAEPLHATVTSITWEVNINGTWTALTSDAIDGNVTQVTLRYTVHTACEDVTSADIVVTNIQTPTPENDLDMTDVPAYNNYGGRLLTVDIKQIKADFGWDVVAEDVTWYMVVEGGNDQKLGTGFYWAKADGTPLEAGQYYARINHTRVQPSECDGILQTVNVLVSEPAAAPKLVPTVARPNELIQVLNLNADAVSTISVYSTTGELMHTFQVANQENATFPAAQLTGYYVVEVLTETEKVSLRYIVK